MVPMKWIVVCMLGVLLTASSAQAAFYSWDNDSGDYLWETGTNWSGNVVPGAADTCWIDTNCSAANPVSLSSTQSVNKFVCGSGATANAYLSHTAGTLTTANGGGFTIGEAGGSQGQYNISGGTLDVSNRWWTEVGKDGTGTLNISGTGAVKFTNTTGQYAFTTVGTNSGSTGTINMSGGSLWQEGTNGGLRVGCFGGSTGYVNQSGGTATLSELRIGSDGGTGTVTVSDSAILSITGPLGVGYHASSTGTFVLDGSRTSGADVSVGTNYTQNAGDTLKGIIDAAAIATASNMRKIVVTGNVTFSAGALLDVAFDGTPAAGTWTLMSWGDSLIGGSNLAFAAGVDTNVWSFTLDSTAKTLTVTYVPEPATLALLGLGGLGLLLRRKR